MHAQSRCMSFDDGQIANRFVQLVPTCYTTVCCSHMDRENGDYRS